MQDPIAIPAQGAGGYTLNIPFNILYIKCKIALIVSYLYLMQLGATRCNSMQPDATLTSMKSPAYADRSEGIPPHSS